MDQRKTLKGKILVTGAAGLIGSALIWQLNRMGYNREIIACDWLPDEDDRWKNLVPLQFGDYMDARVLNLLMHDKEAETVIRLAGLGTIFHMGAVSSTAAGNKLLYEQNYEYTRGLLGRYAENPKVRVVYASSAATYGSGILHFSDDHRFLPELRQDNLYGWYKHRVDMHALKRGWLDRVTAVKFFNVYGPNEHHKEGMQSLVFRAPEEMRRNGGKLRLLGPKDMARDFIYVKDAVDATIHLAQGEHNGIFNVGSGVATTWKTQAEKICMVMGKDPSKVIRWQNLPSEMKARGYQTLTRAVNHKLLVAGFRRQYPGTKGVQDCLDEYVLKGKRLGE